MGDVPLPNTLTWGSLKRLESAIIASCGLKKFKNYDLYEGKGGSIFYRKKCGESIYDGPLRITLLNSTMKKQRRLGFRSSLTKVPRRMSLFHNERKLSSRKSVKKVRFESFTEEKFPSKTSPHICRSLTEGKCGRSRLPRPSGTTGAKRMLFEKLSSNSATSLSKAEDTEIRLSHSTLESEENESFESAKEMKPLVKTSLPFRR